MQGLLRPPWLLSGGNRPFPQDRVAQEAVILGQGNKLEGLET